MSSVTPKHAEEPPRLGIVGIGRVARAQIIPAIRRTGAGVIVACAASSAESARRAAEEFGIPAGHPDWAALIADPRVDAVYVATPNALRREVVLAAASAGKHVLCEKPMALDYADGEAMVAACRDAGVILRVGLQIRLEAVLRRAAEIVREGRLGEIRALSLERMAPLQQSGEWRKRRSQGGSVLFDVGVHLLDLAPWMLGSDFLSLSALAQREDVPDAADDTVTILGETTDGVQVVLRCSRVIPHGGNDLTIMGTKGMLRTGPLRWADRHTLTVIDRSGADEEVFPATDLYGEEVTAFAADIADGGARLPSGEDGLRLIARTAMVEASLRGRGATSRSLPGPMQSLMKR